MIWCIINVCAFETVRLCPFLLEKVDSQSVRFTVCFPDNERARWAKVIKCVTVGIWLTQITEWPERERVAARRSVAKSKAAVCLLDGALADQMRLRRRHQQQALVCASQTQSTKVGVFQFGRLFWCRGLCSAVALIMLCDARALVIVLARPTSRRPWAMVSGQSVLLSLHGCAAQTCASRPSRSLPVHFKANIVSSVSTA